MTRNQAVKLAVDCIEREIHKIGVEANLYDLHIADFPYAQQCSERRKALQEAIKVLEGEHVEQLSLFGVEASQ